MSLLIGIVIGGAIGLVVGAGKVGSVVGYLKAKVDALRKK